VIISILVENSSTYSCIDCTRNMSCIILFLILPLLVVPSISAHETFAL
jgi:hypothetical protein